MLNATVGHYTIINIHLNKATIQCECGSDPRIVDLWYAATSGRKCTTCGCDFAGEKNGNFKGYKEIFTNWIPTLLKKNAQLGINNTDVTMQYMWELFEAQERKCALTGLLIYFRGERNSWGGYVRTASLDRIDSNKPYMKDNIQWVHKDINRMKNKFNEQYFIDMCKLVTQSASSCEVV